MPNIPLAASPYKDKPNVFILIDTSILPDKDIAQSFLEFHRAFDNHKTSYNFCLLYTSPSPRD